MDSQVSALGVLTAIIQRSARPATSARSLLQPARHAPRKALTDRCFDMRFAVGWAGVRAEKLGRAAALARLLQNIHHAEHGPRIIAGVRREPHTEIVRLQLILAAEA